MDDPCSNETHEYHSKKKISLYKERCATKRSQYIEVIGQLTPERLVYTDEEAECDLIFLPRIPPDLNPIEKFGANLKKKIIISPCN